ncbi:hypothetical protein IWX92DRAFT_402667 [Phyllosticta citricarpa]
MEELHRDGNKRQSAGRRQKAIKLALSSAATNFSKSSGGNIHANNTNSKSSTCTILNTSTETATENAQRKVPSAAAGNITTPTTFVAEGGRQLGGQTSETTSTKSKEPLVVLKRLAEPQKLRSEVKRLKTENDEQESKLEEQTLVLARLDQALCQKMREVDQLGESVKDLKTALEEKEEEKSALEDQSRQQDTENSELSKRLEEVVNAKLAMEADLQRQMDRCDDVERQRAALEAEVREKKRRFEGMKKIVKQAVSDQQDSMLELKEKGKRLEGLEKDLKKAEREKAAIHADLKKEQEICEKVQEAKDRKDQLAESAKRSTARLLHIINSIYDSIGDEGTEERDEILGAVRNDLGGYCHAIGSLEMFVTLVDEQAQHLRVHAVEFFPGDQSDWPVRKRHVALESIQRHDFARGSDSTQKKQKRIIDTWIPLAGEPAPASTCVIKPDGDGIQDGTTSTRANKDDQRKPSSCGPSTIIKRLAERPDLLRTEVERLRADNERQDEQIKSRSNKLAEVNQQLTRQTERINNLKQEMLRRATPKTPAAAVASDVDDKKQTEAAALEAKIQDFKKTELPVMRSLAKLIYSVEQMYREVRAVDAASLSSSSSSSSSSSAAEKDRFLDEIEADLGSGRYRYFLRIGKMICEQGLDFPELEETYQVKMEEE